MSSIGFIQVNTALTVFLGFVKTLFVYLFIFNLFIFIVVAHLIPLGNPLVSMISFKDLT